MRGSASEISQPPREHLAGLKLRDLDLPRRLAERHGSVVEHPLDVLQGLEDAEVGAEMLRHPPAAHPLAERDTERLEVLEAPPEVVARGSRRRFPPEPNGSTRARPPLDLEVEGAYVAGLHASLAGTLEVTERPRPELTRRELLAPVPDPVADGVARDSQLRRPPAGRGARCGVRAS